jgi:hypothetical protein
MNTAMKLQFPNPGRSFDSDGGCVRLWGYDSTMEVSFFVETAALKRRDPEMNNVEPECLKAFDNARERIYKVADKLYRHGGGKGPCTYVLAAEDF